MSQIINHCRLEHLKCVVPAEQADYLLSLARPGIFLDLTADRPRWDGSTSREGIYEDAAVDIADEYDENEATHGKGKR